MPALRALRRALPEHQIVLAAPGALGPLVTRTGAVDAHLPTRDPGELTWMGPPPEVAVNLHDAGPRSHTLLDALVPRSRIGLRAPGWDGPEWRTLAARHAHERERWCAVLAHFDIPSDPADLHLPVPDGVHVGRPGAPVLVHPGARSGARRWPAERFAAVAGALNRPGQPVLVTGGADERELGHRVAGLAGLGDSRVLAGRTSLAQLCALVAGAALVVSGDTGLAHLAYAFGTPSVTIFRPGRPRPAGARRRVGRTWCSAAARPARRRGRRRPRPRPARGGPGRRPAAGDGAARPPPPGHPRGRLLARRSTPPLCRLESHVQVTARPERGFPGGGQARAQLRHRRHDRLRRHAGQARVAGHRALPRAVPRQAASWSPSRTCGTR
ncbi:hypothetical protein BJF78_35410 [Pseudonocardia sp. CNS-139]|nr:hypothetical protein BJF78_35410 [Pseudonocardia sp. CNS-139]